MKHCKEKRIIFLKIHQRRIRRSSYLCELGDGALEAINLASDCVYSVKGLGPGEVGERRVDVVARRDDVVVVVADGVEGRH